MDPNPSSTRAPAQPGDARPPAPARAVRPRSARRGRAPRRPAGPEPARPVRRALVPARRVHPGPLGDLLESRALVRIVVMRGTIHLVTAADALVLRALVQPVLDAELTRHQRAQAPPRRRRPRPRRWRSPASSWPTRPGAGRSSGPRSPSGSPTSTPPRSAYACRNHLALVQVPPRGVWGKKLQVTYATTEAWLGRPMDPTPSIDDVVLRYLARVRPGDRRRRRGVVAAHGAGRGRSTGSDRGCARSATSTAASSSTSPTRPRPDPDTPAPVRFLPEYDNVLLVPRRPVRGSCAPTATTARSATSTARSTARCSTTASSSATWNLQHDAKAATGTPRSTRRPPPEAGRSASIEAEGRRFVRFKTDGTADPEVRTTRCRDAAPPAWGADPSAWRGRAVRRSPHRPGCGVSGTVAGGEWTRVTHLRKGSPMSLTSDRNSVRVAGALVTVIGTTGPISATWAVEATARRWCGRRSPPATGSCRRRCPTARSPRSRSTRAPSGPRPSSCATSGSWWASPPASSP